MKRPPRPGEPRITHRTSDSGHVQSFALDDGGFDPVIIEEIRKRVAAVDSETVVEFGPIGLIMAAEKEFSVIKGGLIVSRNVVSGDPANILLTTTLDRDATGMERDTLRMAADFEQCVAIALLKLPMA